MALHHPFSPSRLQGLYLCPGKYNQEKDLPDIPTTADASLGTRIHEAIAQCINKTAEIENLPKDIEDTARQCLEFLERVIGPFLFKKITAEDPLEFSDETGVVYSGTADVVIDFDGDGKITIIDWKTGHNPVTDAKDNLQGAAYALAAMQKYNADRCEVIFFNPTLKSESRFTFRDKDTLAFVINEVIRKAKEETAKTIPGEEQCRYCKANIQGTCPALHNKKNEVLEKAKIMERLESFDIYTDENLCAFLDGFNLVKKMAGAVEEEIKRRCKDVGKCGDYVITYTKGSREVEKIPEAYTVLSGFISQKDFLAACKVSLPKLETAFYTVTKNADKKVTKQAAKARLEEMLSPFVKVSEQKERLKKIGSE